MDDPEIELTTDALDVLNLGNEQSVVPQAKDATTAKVSTEDATTAKVSTAESKSLQINVEDAHGGDRHEVHRNKNVADRYVAPYKLNAAKRRRNTVPDVALKRIRYEEDKEDFATTPVLNRGFTSDQLHHEVTPQRAIWPAGQRPLDLLVARGFRQNENTKGHLRTQGPIHLPDGVDVFAPMENAKLLQLNAALRLEQEDIMARNESLLAQQAAIQSKLRDLNEAVVADELRLEQLKDGLKAQEENRNPGEGK
ncbi:hypothetical protein EDC01DRAFT_630777 [Geopyxis carbonaria]|nr:hypothetical protein EDC01DRAFT_630777 [Geopyxis carbonaria]